MILKIRHKALRRFYETGSEQGLDARWLPQLRMLIATLDDARTPVEMDLPGLRFHPLKGDRAGFYAVDVSGNWRLVFRFAGENTTDIDLVDYH